MTVPSKPGTSYHKVYGNCPDKDAAIQVCYRVAFEFGEDGDLGPLSPAGCKGFAYNAGGYCQHWPMFQSPKNSPEGATAMKIFRVDSEHTDVGCEVDILELGKGWDEPSNTKTFEARCPNHVLLIG